MSEEFYEESSGSSESDNESKEPFLPGDHDGQQELSFDESAYEYFEQIETETSFLSFDLIPYDERCNMNDKTTYDFYIVSGTQVDGYVFLSKTSSVQPLNNDDSDSEYSSPNVTNIGMKHNGGINRVKHNIIDDKNIIATWSDNNFVGVYDITNQAHRLKANKEKFEKNKNLNQIYKSKFHKTEGFGLDWCKVMPNRLASGDQNGLICVHSITDSSCSLNIKASSYSIEDLQWSPQEADILASCGCDSHISVWDIRSNNNQSLRVKAADCDVNVISWSKYDPFIISGDDSGIIKVWDLRNIDSTNPKPVAFFNFHKKAITSLEWHPFDPPCFAASSEDMSITQWDLTAEAEKSSNDVEIKIPPQTMFIHMCENEPKEIHWHPYYSGFVVAVTESTFEIFKSISV